MPGVEHILDLDELPPSKAVTRVIGVYLGAACFGLRWEGKASAGLFRVNLGGSSPPPELGQPLARVIEVWMVPRSDSVAWPYLNVLTRGADAYTVAVAAGLYCELSRRFGPRQGRTIWERLG